MKISPAIAAALGAVAVLFALTLTAFNGLEVSRELAASGAFNTAGNAVFAEASISDGTGTVTTVAAAGTYTTVGTAAPLVAGDTDGSGCLTYTLASNKFTVTTVGGCAGKYRLEACLNDVQGTNAKYWLGAWHRVRGGATTVAGSILRDGTEPTTALRASRGCLVEVVDAAVGDTYDFRYDVETSGNTVTTRGAHFMLQKIQDG